jgi:hypothetical protein
MSRTRFYYETYLKSGEWKRKRKQFRQLLADIKAPVSCWSCGVPEDGILFHVHHRYYPGILGTEPLKSLSLLCENCHNKLHRSHKTVKKSISLWDFSNAFIKQERQKNGLEAIATDLFEFVPPEAMIFKPSNSSKQQSICWSLTKKLKRCQNKPVKQGLCNSHRPTKSRPHQRPITEETS